ncbi:MAG: orotidine-5'-phosphate decarboxylase [Deltaproteobacteria bacterium]|nr:orotidine-5'-phosphate decarboxylase [Deltaproteobacteria bacterium]
MSGKNIPIEERIIFALDMDSVSEAEMWVKRLESRVRFFKVGLQLFMASWFTVIDMILARDLKVMCDLKFFDIPETVKLAVAELSKRNITFATVHGNRPIVEAAASAKGDMKILAVTVLTSFDEGDMKEMGLTGSVSDMVMRRAKSSIENGCDGVVCSGMEARALRENLGDDFLMVTPGIRPQADAQASVDDQRRIVTAERAIVSGADHIVVGRPISRAKDPLNVVESMQEEIRRGLLAKG